MNHTVLCLALLLPLASQAQQSCLVVAVTDGDTIRARCGELGSYKQVTVRLGAIDAPEKKQPFGNASKQHLSDLCFEQNAIITERTKDRYGRTVGDVQCKGQDVGEAMVQSGMAWVYTQYAQGYTRLPTLQSEARTKRRGLWADKAPTPPWEFRHPSPVSVAHQAVVHGAECHVGPRGGTYTITASGRKNYGGC
jgi:endonuclease YncB( thermonuclease family)